jgi:hypothetical protein
VGGAPSRHTGTGGAAADGVHEDSLRESGGGSRVVPRRKQLGKQPDEAMPISRGDARAAERARTGGRGEDGPLTRLADLFGGFALCSGDRGSTSIVGI